MSWWKLHKFFLKKGFWLLMPFISIAPCIIDFLILNQYRNIIVLFICFGFLSISKTFYEFFKPEEIEKYSDDNNAFSVIAMKISKSQQIKINYLKKYSMFSDYNEFDDNELIANAMVQKITEKNNIQRKIVTVFLIISIVLYVIYYLIVILDFFIPYFNATLHVLL